MKSTILVGLMFFTASAFSSEELKVNCSYAQDISTSQIEQTVVDLAKANSNSGYNSFVSQSISITDGQQSGYRALVCVTSRL